MNDQGSLNQGRAFASRTDGGIAKQEEADVQQAPVVIEPQFKVFNSADDITYAPETALKEGVGMVKTIKEALKKLELGSKLRQDVWDREIKKYDFDNTYKPTTHSAKIILHLSLDEQGSPKTLIAVCGGKPLLLLSICHMLI